VEKIGKMKGKKVNGKGTIVWGVGVLPWVHSSLGRLTLAVARVLMVVTTRLSLPTPLEA